MLSLTTLIAVGLAGITAAVVPLPFVWRFVIGILALVVALTIIAFVKVIFGVALLILVIVAVAFIASRLSSSGQRPTKN